MCERGVQLRNPFYSIWVTDIGTKLAVSFSLNCFLYLKSLKKDIYKIILQLIYFLEQTVAILYNLSWYLCWNIPAILILYDMESIYEH